LDRRRHNGEVDLERQGLSVWRYVWNPDSLDVGEYSIEYRLIDVDDAVIVTGEDLIVRDVAEQLCCQIFIL
jgi:hypothetical protein